MLRPVPHQYHHRYHELTSAGSGTLQTDRLGDFGVTLHCVGWKRTSALDGERPYPISLALSMEARLRPKGRPSRRLAPFAEEFYQQRSCRHEGRYRQYHEYLAKFELTARQFCDQQ